MSSASKSHQPPQVPQSTLPSSRRRRSALLVSPSSEAPTSSPSPLSLRRQPTQLPDSEQVRQEGGRQQQLWLRDQELLDQRVADFQSALLDQRQASEEHHQDSEDSQADHHHLQAEAHHQDSRADLHHHKALADNRQGSSHRQDSHHQEEPHQDSDVEDRYPWEMKERFGWWLDVVGTAPDA